MSQWTHITGVIVYDSFVCNVWPIPKNKKKMVKEQLALVSNEYNKLVPEGSEGPIEVDVIITERGPTVVLTGDLRDFGKNDIHLIVDWLNNRKLKEVFFLHVRTANIICDVEFDDHLYIIKYDYEKDDNRFILNIFEKNEIQKKRKS